MSTWLLLVWLVCGRSRGLMKRSERECARLAKGREFRPFRMGLARTPISTRTWPTTPHLRREHQMVLVGIVLLVASRWSSRIIVEFQAGVPYSVNPNAQFEEAVLNYICVPVQLLCVRMRSRTVGIYTFRNLHLAMIIFVHVVLILQTSSPNKGSCSQHPWPNICAWSTTLEAFTSS